MAQLRQPQSLFFLLTARIGDAERLQLPMKRRTLHADERGGARDVAGEAPDLDLQIFALERLPGLAQRSAHDRLDRLARAEARLLVEDLRRQHVDLDRAD